MIDQVEQSMDHDLDSGRNRIGKTCVYALSSLMAFGLVGIVHWAVQSTGSSGLMPLVVLFDELVIAVGIVMILKTLSLWFPACAVWNRLEQRVGHQLAITAVIVSTFVYLVIGYLILLALGII